MNFTEKPIRLTLAVCTSLIIILGFYIVTPQKLAIAQSNSLNGVCVGALTMARKGTTPINGKTTSISYRLDLNFSASTAALEALSTNFDTPSPKGYKTNAAVGTATYAISNGLVTGSYLLTPTGGNPNNFPTLYLLPAASSTTFFMQVKDDDTTGICVKV
jgi:hypothetical protein